MPARPSRKTKTDRENPPVTTSSLNFTKPKWPQLKPLIPRCDASINPLIPNQIVTISNLWTSSLCKTYTSFLSSLPLTTTPGRPKKGEALRVNDRFQIDDPAFSELLWSATALKELVVNTSNGEQLWGGDVLGLNPNIRIYRYTKGQFFDQHYDDSNNVTLPGDPPALAKTTWTLLLYLTSPSTGCVGGETVFYPEPPSKKESPPDPVVVGLETGMALLHRHGVDCMLHEGREVTAGEKWVIRSDLCVRR
ncbi:MAG: hypothetical protein M1820_008873 [Bogoriella megaspora]|nr:MAG: hypothetical protein M1820_008873 [Bogoriella megaspora]